MKFMPHDYQSYCVEYIKTHPIAALLLDMGLGKTAITLTAVKDLMLDELQVSKALVVAPLRVARDTWPSEVRKWDHLAPLDVSVSEKPYRGAESQGAYLCHQPGYSEMAGGILRAERHEVGFRLPRYRRAEFV